MSGGFVSAVSKMMDKKDTSSGNIISDRLIDYLEDFDDDYAKDTFFHVSSLYYMCPRCEVYKAVLTPDRLPQSSLDAITQARFDIGHAMHWWYQNKYLGPMGVLKGKWKCSRCEHIVNGLMPSVVCEKCGKKAWEFEETVVMSKKWNILGKTDGVLLHNDEEVVLDLKTCKPSLFSSLKKPWPSAIYQVQVYMWMLKIKRGVLLYIDKSADGVVPVKEFPVEYSLDTINNTKGKITSFKLGMETQSLPDCLCRSRSFGLRCPDIEKTAGAMDVVEKWVESGAKEGKE